jgi:hypothetical protein
MSETIPKRNVSTIFMLERRIAELKMARNMPKNAKEKIITVNLAMFLPLHMSLEYFLYGYKLFSHQPTRETSKAPFMATYCHI